MKLKLAASKMVALTLAVVVWLAGTGAAFAGNGSDSAQKANRLPHPRVNFEKMSATYQSVLDSLVNKGTLTQEQARAVINSMPAPGEKPDGKPVGKAGVPGQPRERKSPLEQLVAAGTITQEQLDSFREAMKAARDSDKSREDILEELVNDGILTQEQADAIFKCIPAKPEGKPFGKTGAPGQPRERKGPLSQLVKAGTITQEQADAINEAVREALKAILL